jgi:hypothetical protein
LVITVCAGTSSTCSMTVSLRPIWSTKGTMSLRPGIQGARVAAEALDGPLFALGHRLDAGEYQHHDDDRQDAREDQKSVHTSAPGRKGSRKNRAKD